MRSTSEQPDTITPTEGATVVGTGWDSTKQAMKAVCVDSPARPTGGVSANIELLRRVSQREAEQALGVQVGAKARFTVGSAAAALRFAESMKEDAYSEVFTYVADYDLGWETFDDRTRELTATGLAAQRAGSWETSCGDEYVWRIRRAARLFVVFRIDFASQEAKSTFHAEASGSYNAVFSSGEFDVQVDRAARRFANQASVHLSAYQVGGDVAKVSGVASGIQEAGSAGARAMVDCSLTNLAACRQFVTNALDYATNLRSPLAFPAQVAAQGGAPVEYLTQPWDVLALPRPPRLVTDALAEARADLVARNEIIGGARTRVRRLLTSKMPLTSQHRQELEAWDQRLETETGDVLSAVRACWDDLAFEPAEVAPSSGGAPAANPRAGEPFTAKVQTCRDAVARVQTDTPSAALIDAAGRYAVEAKGNEFGVQLGYLPLRDDCYFVGFKRICVGRYVPTYKSAKDGGVYMDDWSNGAVYWHPDTAARAVWGPPFRLWDLHGRENGPLGYPTSDGPSGHGIGESTFQGGVIVARGADTRAIHGRMHARWKEWSGASGLLGFPAEDEVHVAQGNGRAQRFEGGSLFWRDRLAAKDRPVAVFGALRDAYVASGGPAGPLGWPRQDAYPPDSAVAATAVFEHGVLVRHEHLGLHLLTGSLAQKYLTYGTQGTFSDVAHVGAPSADRGAGFTLGYPVSGVEAGPGERHVDFERGCILESAAGTFVVPDTIRGVWSPRLGELGWPVGDPDTRRDGLPGDFVQRFERGAILGSARGGVHALPGDFARVYEQANGCLGVPLTDVQPEYLYGRLTGATEIMFERGGLITRRVDGSFTTRCARVE